MTRPTPTPRPQVQPKPQPQRPQPERLDTPGGRTLPVMIGGPADFGM
ncbi:hypothetical protein [Deinococcus geothermalis]|nr:hypothetical protein [Deinococcus geothermalis]